MFRYYYFIVLIDLTVTINGMDISYFDEKQLS